VKTAEASSRLKRMVVSRLSAVRASRGPQQCFPNLASFRQVDAESEIAFSKKEETFQESPGILSPLRLPVPPRPLVDLLGVFDFTRQVLCSRSEMLCKTCSRCVLYPPEGADHIGLVFDVPGIMRAHAWDLSPRPAATALSFAPCLLSHAA
jgi:hypothetical protein